MRRLTNESTSAKGTQYIGYKTLKSKNSSVEPRSGALSAHNGTSEPNRTKVFTGI